MSTKIYNGYMSDLPLHKLLDKFKEVLPGFKKTILEGFYKSLIKEYIISCDVKKEEITLPGLSNYHNTCDEYLKDLGEYKRSSHEVDLDLKTDCCVFPLRGKTLILFYTDNQPANKFWESLDFIKDYHYQNQTDRPDNITARQWKKRKNDWDLVLGGNGWGKPIDNGYSFTFHSRELPMRYHMRDWLEFMIEHAPTDDFRKKNLLRDKLWGEKYATIPEEEKENNRFQFSEYLDFRQDFQAKYESGEYQNLLDEIELIKIDINWAK